MTATYSKNNKVRTIKMKNNTFQDDMDEAFRCVCKASLLLSFAARHIRNRQARDKVLFAIRDATDPFCDVATEIFNRVAAQTGRKDRGGDNAIPDGDQCEMTAFYRERSRLRAQAGEPGETKDPSR